MVRTVYIPSFLYTQVNKKEGGGFMTQEEVIESNLQAAIQMFDEVHSSAESCVAVCLRKKMDDGNFKYGIMVTGTEPPAGDDSKLMKVVVPDFEDLPTIIIHNKKDVAELVERILKNLTFA